MNPAAIPEPVKDVQGDGRWMSQHHRFVMEAKEKEPEVVFVGDSLIGNLGRTKLWDKMFEPQHCLNFGIGGDTTQHVLWRIQNGELDCIEPKLIVLLVGTNNYNHTAEQVAGGIVEIVNFIQQKQPAAQILVLGIPPRGEKPNKLREKIAKINSSLSEQFENKSYVTFLNADPAMFVSSSDGTISASDMYDYLHLTDVGYKKFCEPLLEEMQNLLGNFLKVENTTIDSDSIAGELAGDQP